MDLDDRYTRNDAVIARPLQEGGVLYRSDRERLFVLNETGYLIWQLCDGSRSLAEIAAAVTREFNVDRAIATRDVQAYVTRLAEMDLLTPAAVTPTRE